MASEVIVSDAPPPVVRLCTYRPPCYGVAIGYIIVADGARIDVCNLCAGIAHSRGLEIELDPSEKAYLERKKVAVTE